MFGVLTVTVVEPVVISTEIVETDDFGGIVNITPVTAVIYEDVTFDVDVTEREVFPA